eukprot:CAMPEP_0194046024 /NCGR_PEP_ID=MMETSP0009_2-20130614/19128_1 /TAXON_ID=210454 /ORGANISM="Grammatophora oceanica, Strain CCMP 410" /LENGTH=224 /DNA_ID=CAMNT_0038691129 /DNA_START=40 /DNA_END=714 /DNA_ORIENTATION=+
MSWKAGLSRHLPFLRFFGCTQSPASRGVFTWFEKNYEELKYLNPEMPLMMRCHEGAFPAVVTELEFTQDDVFTYMLEKKLFRNADGTVASDREEAARAYMSTDWAALRQERWASPGFDPAKPYLEEDNPNWRDDPVLAKDLATYIELKDAADNALTAAKAGPNKEYERAENSLLLCQRVDLWCAGESEVERAVMHLAGLGRKLNTLENEDPEFVTEFYPGAEDL